MAKLRLPQLFQAIHELRTVPEFGRCNKIAEGSQLQE